MRKIRMLVGCGVLLGAASASWAQASAPVTAAPPAQAAEAPKPAAPKGLEFPVGDWKIKFYGFVCLDLHYDDSHPNNTRLISTIKPEDDPAPPTIGEEKNSEDFTMHARNSRFGIDITGPAVSLLGDAKPSGKIEFDFLANGGSEALVLSRGVIRMRLAYLKLAWEDFSVLAGQAWDVAAPLIPTANREFLMWGAGNPGDRRPQIRPEYQLGVGDGRLIFQAAAGLTGAFDGENLDGSTTWDGEASGLPTLQGRLAVKWPCLWLEKKSFEIGGWGHYAKEHLDAMPAGWPADADDDYTSTAYGVDLTLPLLDFLEIRGEAWQGKNVNDLRGGILQAGVQIGDDPDPNEVESRGYWVEILFKPLDWYTLCLGTSRDNPVNSDLTRTLAAGSNNGAEDNRVFYIANRFNVGGGVSFGLDYLNWTTKWRGGDLEGDDNRVSAFAQYSF